MHENRILGIDPGSITCGYGLIKSLNNYSATNKRKTKMNASNLYLDKPDFMYITSGSITLSPRNPLSIRLRILYKNLLDIINTYKPHEIVVERVFFAKNIRATLNLGHARGIALLAAASEGLDIYEYSALEVKKAVTGYGRAEKRQVIEMVKRIFNLNSKTITLTADSADALARTLCHLNTKGFKKKIKI